MAKRNTHDHDYACGNYRDLYMKGSQILVTGLMNRICMQFPISLLFVCSAFCETVETDGYLVYTLGKDTSMIGNYRLTGNKFEMKVLSREYAIVYHQTGSFNNKGEIESVEGISYTVEYNKAPQNISNYLLYVKNDSTHTIIKQGENIRKYVYKGKGIVNNMIGHTAFFLLPIWACYSPPVGDSLVSQHMWWGNPKKYIIKRNTPGSMLVGSTLMGFLTMHLDPLGKVTSIDGLGSSLNLVGHVFPYKEMDSTINAFTFREHTIGKIGTNNKPDSVIATINSNGIKLYYNRPSMRGRQIFGNVVPYNRFWRTGANQATIIQFEKSIFLNGNKLPAGSYSIFTFPKQDSWTMMINKEVDIWGTEYDPNQDILRVPMDLEELKEPVELMTIEILPLNNRAILSIMWENKKASVFLTTD